MVLVALIILLLGLVFLLPPCLRCVRASSSHAKLRVVIASQVENIPVILSEENKIIPMGVAFFRVQVLESFSVFIGDALRAPNLFSERKVASKSLNQKGNVGIGTSAPTQSMDTTGSIVTGGIPGDRIMLGGASLGFNRNVAIGSIYNSGAYAYQFQHTGSTTNTNDFLALQVYNNSGTQVSRAALAVTGAGNVGIVFTCPFFRSSIGAISRATNRAFQNFRTQAKRHRNRAQGGGSPRASPFLVTVSRSAPA